MIKIVYCLTRKQGLTREQFQEYWLHQHSESVLERAATIGMVKYAQSHTITSNLGNSSSQSRGAAEPYDGVMEGWWESDDAAAAAMSTDGGHAAAEFLLADESTFIDFSKSRIFTTQEFVWKITEAH